MLLDAKDDLKLADFAGSSIDGSEASVNYEVRSRLPGISKPTEKSDIFALGSALFELATGSPPYSGESNKAVQNLYKKLKFADVSMLPELGPIIKKCWRQGYGTTVEVVEALDRLESYGSTQKALHLEAPVVNSATPALDTPDISRLEIKKSTSRRDREVSPTYVLHASRRRSAHRRGNYTETATEKRRQRRKHSRPTFIHKFIMPWLSPIQKET
jgi:serine/threonine protein kinase